MAAEVAVAEILEKMRVRDEDDDRTVLSKKLSYVLRHGAKQFDLQISDDGFVSVQELLSIGILFAGVSLETLVEFVDSSNAKKQRYELEEQPGNDFFIRAINKHTMDTVEKEKLPTKEREHRPPRRSLNREESLINEEAFCGRWKLDRLAKARLQELPTASRQQAMQRFRPGHEVPPNDYPKVFVAFCKRFKKAPFHNREQELQSEDHAGTAQGGQQRQDKSRRRLAGEEDAKFALDLERVGDQQQDVPHPHLLYLSPDSSPRSPAGMCSGGGSMPPSQPTSPQVEAGVALLGTTPPFRIPMPEQPMGFDQQQPWPFSQRFQAPPVHSPVGHTMRGGMPPPPPAASAPAQLQCQWQRSGPPPPPAHAPQVAGLPSFDDQAPMYMEDAARGGSWSPPASPQKLDGEYAAMWRPRRQQSEAYTQRQWHDQTHAYHIDGRYQYGGESVAGVWMPRHLSC